MIAFLYFIQHLSSVFLLRKKTISLFVLFSLITLISIYIFKNDTYDIPRYTEAVSYGHSFEPAFAGLVLFLKVFINDPRTITGIIQFALGILWLSLLKYLSKNKRVTAVFIII